MPYIHNEIHDMQSTERHIFFKGIHIHAAELFPDLSGYPRELVQHKGQETRLQTRKSAILNFPLP